jgi:hypothetical protein
MCKIKIGEVETTHRKIFSGGRKRDARRACTCFGHGAPAPVTNKRKPEINPESSRTTDLHATADISPVKLAMIAGRRTRRGSNASIGAVQWVLWGVVWAGQLSLNREVSRRNKRTWPGEQLSIQCTAWIGTSMNVRPMMLAAATVTDTNTTQLLANATQNTGREGCAAKATTGVVSSRDQNTHFRFEVVLRSNTAKPPVREPAATRRPLPDADIAVAAS